ncbi:MULTISPECIES: flagellin [Rhizobium]|uniref:Flagellin n=1 Tax=Rhizobium rhododendri TaxID=2506430 RepID=A0ABY8IHR5_9HYPH|nr:MULTISPECIES: flagellin [Rhizobium]MBZ5760392.1 flagellin [Rhizobium sp. VS19-DR96]MBZ5766764.1 flagellin [Rhizobium sp. VS19-DR129.2]MBZ5773243.1 flagellin [Rhizobium sp. VS19-DRK62.2]MBZ5784227.1 flagellin [Rhizobium sp. VS19-DR121]MBZ5802587.1 flagellin [Rhizobium sp. VS19-DR181]
MSSLTTNAFALGALTVLRGVNKDLSTAQQQVSSGYRIGSAADDPSYWSMSMTMKSDSSSLKTIGDAMSLGASKVDTAYTAMTSVIDVLTEIQAKLVSASETGVDKDKLNTDIQALKAQLQSTVESASFAGSNWLYNSQGVADTSQSVISNFVRGTSGQVTLNTIDYDSSQSLMIDTADPSRGLLTKTVDANSIASDGTGTARNYYLLAPAGSTGTSGGTEISLSAATTSGQVTDMLNVTHSLLTAATSAASNMGVTKARIDSQTTFVAGLQDAIDTSVGDLVDTNMEEASARVTSLTTAQQLGVQSLSIANTMASKILVLLQNG